MTDDDRIKLFAMTNQMLEHDLGRIEEEYAIDLQRGFMGAAQVDAAYYPQIEQAIRAEAARMAPHYEMFYSLETSIRRVVAEALADAEADDWSHSARINDRIRADAQRARKREVDAGITVRSEALIDFTNFGDLSEIITSNWDIFGPTFSSQQAVRGVMSRLNSLRGPIAHCSPLADDEVNRLQISVRDWFRLMS